MDVQHADTVHIPYPSTTKLTPSSTYPTQYVLYQDFTYARVRIGSAGTCLTTGDRLSLPSPTRLEPLLFPTASVTNPTPPPPAGLITYLINLPTVRQQLSVTAITSSCDPIVGGSLVTPLQTVLPVVQVTTVFELYAETVTHRITAPELASATSLSLPMTSLSGLTAVVTTLRSSSYSPVLSSNSPVSSLLPPPLSLSISSASSYLMTASSPTSFSRASQLDGSLPSLTQSREASSTKSVSYLSSAVASTITVVFDTTTHLTVTSRGQSVTTRLHNDHDPAYGRDSTTNSRETSRSYIEYASLTTQPMTSRQIVPSGRPRTPLIGLTAGNVYSNSHGPILQQEESSTSTSTPRMNTADLSGASITGSEVQQSATSAVLVSSNSLSLYRRYSRAVWMFACLLLSLNI